ncbi:MAG: hypothetical protein A2X08_11335 [Bacteroidetes bacterium GWA2_32_17]|nr:MAG: hypothetical protein A2X08_11335 [Bacteroidetes bacterium GWA2_32_17]
MLKFLVIDDTYCEKELHEFLNKRNVHVQAFIATKEIAQQAILIVENLKSNLTFNKRLAVNSADSTCIFNASEIIRCESSRNYTNFILTNNRIIIASKTLIEFEKKLVKYNCFVRIHKSHLININFIEKYLKADGGYVVLKDGTKLPVATRKKELLFNELEKL